MSAGFHHFIIEQGATFSKTLTLRGSDNALTDLTGYTTGEMDLRSDEESSSEVLTLTVDNGRIAFGGSAGTVTLTIPSSVTASMSASDGVYDLVIGNSAGNKYRILEGTYSVRRGVSR
jgi:hypothetical protein